jgi:hypothetical protein
MIAQLILSTLLAAILLYAWTEYQRSPAVAFLTVAIATQPPDQETEVVADGGEDGIVGVAFAVGEIVAVHSVPTAVFECGRSGLARWTRQRRAETSHDATKAAICRISLGSAGNGA